MRSGARVRLAAVVMAGAVVAGAATACGKRDVTPPGVVCALYAAAGLNVTVTDSVSGAPVSGATVVAVGRNGARNDSTITGSGGTAALLYEAPGSFDVTVRLTGYTTWSRAGIAIAKDVCHVIPVSLGARLQRP
ncbi:MAG: carboxypeptidase-like regulatory domain-containing protein [Gemmatimonadetes bacterium]|nr:carboxypeptidase-like regulatory domain-containing protein [Gemmatimonadota bacterium]